MSAPVLIGTPVITVRQWTTALSPNSTGDGWNFITQAYNYPDNAPTEWIVVHLETETQDTYIGPNAVYSNANYQVASAETSVTTTNQLRAPDGNIFFLGNIGTPTVFIAYYDAADEQVKFVSANVAPASQTFLYVGVFDHVGAKLYIGTQADGSTTPGIVEVDVASKAITWLGQGGNLSPGFPTYAYTVAKDEGPGADWVYFARGQAGWDLVALQISTGIATILHSTVGPGFEYIQVSGDTTSCRAVIYDNGVPTNYYVFDGALSLVPPGTTRDCTPFDGSLINPPEINWTHGIGQVLYKLPQHYQVLTPTTAEFPAIVATNPAIASKPAPSLLYQCQEATGALVNTGTAVGHNFVATNTVGLSYANVTALWGDRLSLHFTEAAANHLTATIANANANSILVFLYVQQYVTPIAIRSVLETDAGYIEIATTNAYRADANSGVTGTTDVGTTWRMVGVLYNRTTNTFDVVVDKRNLPMEVINAAYFAGAGTNLVLGGSAGTSTAPMNVNYIMGWTGAAAEWTLPEIQALMDVLKWNDPIVTPDWVEVDYTASNAAPIVLESLITLPSNTPLTNGVQYCGFANRLLWHGAWPGGPSQPQPINVDNLVYLSGYPDGVLYRYNEAIPWAPDGSSAGNPSKLGSYSSGTDLGMKYPYFIRYDVVNNRIYAAGRRERDHDGSSLGWYKITQGTFSVPMNDPPLNEYRAPSGLVVCPLLGLIAFSGRLFSDSSEPEAKILVYDTELNLLHQWTALAGSTDTGNLFSTSLPNVIMGFGNSAGNLHSVAYRMDILTGTVLQTVNLDYTTYGAITQIDNATIYLSLDDVLYSLSTDTLTLTQLAPIGFSPTYISKSTAGLYLTIGPSLYSMGLDPTTIICVEARANHLRFLVTSGTGVLDPITTDDLLAVLPAGPLRQLALAYANGIGKLLAGAKTQSQARALWLSDHSRQILGALVPSAVVRVTPRLGVDPLVDADVDGSGKPLITMTASGSYEFYLDVELPGAIGL